MPQTNTQPLLGAHISIAGGPEQAIYRGESIGCTAIQIFTKSNRQWSSKPFSQEEIDAFKKAWKNSSIKSVVVHAAYLINLASPQSDTVTKSVQALVDELYRCEQLGIPYLVLHPGSHGDLSEKRALDQINQNLDTIFDHTPGATMILLETMAGQGTNICYRLEQIAHLYHTSHHKERLGICLDTCHLFAAGYDIRTPNTYETFLRTFQSSIGDLELIRVIHINDSKKALGSRIDRHEDIGKGMLGLEPFRLLCTDQRFAHVPKILETPKKGLEDDARNLAIIRSLL